MNILIANNVAALNNSFIVDDLLADNLQTLGGNVYFTKCSGILPACINTKFDYVYKDNIFDRIRNFNKWKLSKKACNRCNVKTASMKPSYNIINLDDIDASDNMSSFLDNNLNNCTNGENIFYRGVDIKEHAFSGTVRFFANGNPFNEVQYENIFKNYFASAVLSTELAYYIFAKYSIDVICAHHGIYVPQGPFVDVAKILNKRIITWNIGGQKKRLFFCDKDTYHKEFPKRKVKNYNISCKNKDKVQNYLLSRETGVNDWLKFHTADRGVIKPIEDIRQNNSDVKIISMFTNVFWDAQLHFKENLFDNMLDWIIKTIHHIKDKENTYLIVREHPGEFKGQQVSRYMVSNFLLSNNLLSDKIILIKSKDAVNSYQLAEESDFSLVYGSKMTHELSARGVKVIVAGDAWAKNKGFTIDPVSENEYYNAIDECLDGKALLKDNFKDLALAFCYEFYYEWSIKVDSLLNLNDKDSSNKNQLMRKKNKNRKFDEKQDIGLMKICDNILNNKPFW